MKKVAPITGLSMKLKRMNLKPGQVLVLHIDPRDKAMPVIIDSIHAWLKRNGLPKLGVLVLNRDETVESLSEKRMREMGWIRPYEVIT